MLTNLILNTDSYKSSHFLQYPPNTTTISSYIESRGGEYEETVFFGLQMFLKSYLSKPITLEDIAEAKDVLSAHGLPFNEEGFKYIVENHKGYLPVEIEAVAEGTVLPTKNVIVQIRNTDSKCFWLTSYLETALLRAVWYPVTVATLSYHCKKTIREFMERTSDSLDGINFKLHDFGARGTSSQESAAIGGLGHLVNFMGTDTIAALLYARKFYDEPMAAFSIPAAEHSTITSWGKENEEKAYANMLKAFGGKNKLVAVVSDSYDLFNTVENIWGGSLKQQVIDTGGTLVIRPDSGDPAEIVSKTIGKLIGKFGSTKNSKGYEVLPPCVRVIQGDGISPESIRSILYTMEMKGYSADNIAFGMGGELLQKINRDTLRFAMKASGAEVDGVWRDVYKDPITDPGKKSKRGRLALIKDADGFKTVRLDGLAGRANLLTPVFRDGKLLKEYTFKEVREKAAS